MLFIGNSFVELEQVDSTNGYALDKLRQGETFPDGCIIFSQNQLAGRGQRGTEWQSNAGENLTCSIVLFPKKIGIDKQFMLSKCIALGISEFLTSFGLANVRVKWPNDILVNNKKICGILIENILHGAQIESSVVGIGLNINQVFDSQKGFVATSIYTETGKKEAIMDILNQLCSFIEVRYLQLIQLNFEKINSAYLSALFLFKHRTSFLYKDARIEASIMGVSETGKLVLRDEYGTIIESDMKEIKFL